MCVPESQTEFCCFLAVSLCKWGTFTESQFLQMGKLKTGTELLLSSLSPVLWFYVILKGYKLLRILNPHFLWKVLFMVVRLKCSKKKSKMRKGSELILKSYIIGGWGDGSVVKSTDCSSRGPGFDSQHPHCGSHTYVTPHPKPSSGLR